MDFLVPEYALELECTAASDMFSLGMVAFALYNTTPTVPTPAPSTTTPWTPGIKGTLVQSNPSLEKN